MKTIIIKHSPVCSEIIQNIPDNVCGSDIVESWQKKQTNYLLRGQLKPCTWKVAETNNFIKCMIESHSM